MRKRIIWEIVFLLCACIFSGRAAIAANIIFSGSGQFTYGDIESITQVTPGNTVVSEPIQLVGGTLTKTFAIGSWIGLVSSRFTQTFSNVSLSSTFSGSYEVILMPFTAIPNPYVPGDTYGFQILPFFPGIPLITDGSVHTYTLPSQTNGFFVIPSDPIAVTNVSFIGFSSSGVTPVPENPTYLMLLIGLLLVCGLRLSGAARNIFCTVIALTLPHQTPTP